MKIKVTEIGFYPMNSEGNKVVEQNTMSGDFNLINPMFCAYKKQLDRQKQSYVFKVERDNSVHYSYSLKNSETVCDYKQRGLVKK